MKYARYSGVAAVLTLWTGIGWAMLHSGLGFFDSRPLSYLGVNSSTQTVFTLVLITSALLIISFGFYLYQNFSTNKLFITALVVGQIAQIITALAPDTGSTKLLHTIFAFTIVFTLPLLMWQFAKCQKGHFRKICYQLAWLEVASFVIGIGLFTLTKGVAPLGEMLPAMAFHLWIIVVTLNGRILET